MSVTIKLRREGGKKKSYYQIIVIDSKKTPQGKYIEKLGYYQPLSEPYTLEVNKDSCLEWMKKGARLTKTVETLFKKAGLLKKN